MPGADDEAEVAEQQSTKPQGVTSRSAVDDWVQKHANLEFVAVPNKTVTKRPKFEGAKPGWVLKFGEKRLGYYRDRGRLVAVVSLAHALPAGAKFCTRMPPIPMCLDEVIGKQDSVPVMLQHASRIVFTPAGVAATFAALLSSGATSAEAVTPSQSVQQRGGPPAVCVLPARARAAPHARHRHC